jgi:outer membrane protein TolC
VARWVLLGLATLVAIRRRGEAEIAPLQNELATVNHDLQDARDELSRLKGQQDPHVIFNIVRREVEWQAKRGGPKSPF